MTFPCGECGQIVTAKQRHDYAACQRYKKAVPREKRRLDRKADAIIEALRGSAAAKEAGE